MAVFGAVVPCSMVLTAVKMEAASIYETSVNFYQTIRRYKLAAVRTCNLTITIRQTALHHMMSVELSTSWFSFGFLHMFRYITREFVNSKYIINRAVTIQ
jgi:hypothetical protein